MLGKEKVKALTSTISLDLKPPYPTDIAAKPYPSDISFLSLKNLIEGRGTVCEQVVRLLDL